MNTQALENRKLSILPSTFYDYKELQNTANLLAGFNGFEVHIVKGLHDDFGRVIIIPDNTDYIFRMVRDKNKKYHFDLDFSTRFKYHGIEYRLQSEALKYLKRPNDIGVFNQNKIDQWIQYLKSTIVALDNLLNSHTEEGQSIQKQIDDFIKSIPNAKVSSYHNRTCVYGKYFDVTFEHDKQSNYLSKKIEYKGGLANVTKFENI